MLADATLLSAYQTELKAEAERQRQHGTIDDVEPFIGFYSVMHGDIASYKSKIASGAQAELNALKDGTDGRKDLFASINATREGTTFGHQPAPKPFNSAHHHRPMRLRPLGLGPNDRGAFRGSGEADVVEGEGGAGDIVAEVDEAAPDAETQALPLATQASQVILPEGASVCNNCLIAFGASRQVDVLGLSVEACIKVSLEMNDGVLPHYFKGDAHNRKNCPHDIRKKRALSESELKKVIYIVHCACPNANLTIGAHAEKPLRSSSKGTVDNRGL